MDKILAELKAQFELFKEFPFPQDSSDEELSIIHADLVGFDTYIAGLLDTICRGGVVENQLLAYDHNLENRIRNALAEGKELFQGEQYLRYILVIKKLIDLAKRV